MNPSVLRSIKPVAMSYSQNGQYYYGQQSNAQQPHPSQQGAYSSSRPGEDQYVRRASSFDSGDDAPFVEEANGGPHNLPGFVGNGRPAGGYTPFGGVGLQPDELFMGPPTSPLPNRTSAYGLALSGYQHHYQPPNSPSLQSTYNPQQFARSQSQYNPQSYTRASQNYSANQQPYNPAAYSPSVPQRHSTYAGSQSTGYTPPLPYAPSMPPPPLPPPPQASQGEPYGAWTGSQYDQTAPRHSGYWSNTQNLHSSNLTQPLGSMPLPPRLPALPLPSIAGSDHPDDARNAQTRPLSYSSSPNSNHNMVPFKEQDSSQHYLPSLPDYYGSTTQSSPVFDCWYCCLHCGW